MARALARGWGEPVLVHRRAAPAAPRRSSTSSAARRSPPTPSSPSAPTSSCSCHKPDQLEAVAAEVARHAQARASRSSAATPLARRCGPPTRARPVFRVDAEHAGRGAPRRDRASPRRGPTPSSTPVRELFERARDASSRSPERLIDVADGAHGRRARPTWRCSSRRRSTRRCAHGLPAGERRPSSSSRRWRARPRCCARRGDDTLAVRRAVTSPGGVHRPRARRRSSAAGVRAAFQDAIDARRRTGAPADRRLAATRATSPNYVDALFRVYIAAASSPTSSLIADLRVRRPAPVLALVERGARASCATSCEPYLRIFRRFIPPSGRSTSARSSRSSCCGSSAAIVVNVDPRAERP